MDHMCDCLSIIALIIKDELSSYSCPPETHKHEHWSKWIQTFTESRPTLLEVLEMPRGMLENTQITMNKTLRTEPEA